VSVEIRPARDSDREEVWAIFHAVEAAGDAYAFEPDISREEALEYWFAPTHHCVYGGGRRADRGGIYHEAEPAGTRLTCRECRVHGRAGGSLPGSGAKDGRALACRGAPVGLSRDAIQTWWYPRTRRQYDCGKGWALRSSRRCRMASGIRSSATWTRTSCSGNSKASDKWVGKFSVIRYHRALDLLRSHLCN
jgi:hypothetical protein